MADGARLESVFTLIGNGGSNPPLSAITPCETALGIFCPLFHSQSPSKIEVNPFTSLGASID